MRAEPIARHPSSVHVTRWEPGSGGGFSALFQQIDHPNLAQAPQWFTAIKKAYGHTPVYLKAENYDGQVAFLPAFLIRRRLLGTVVTSMPFLDAGGPCSPSAGLARDLVDALIEEATRLGANQVELRYTADLELPFPATKDKVTLVLPLPKDPDCLWKKFNAKVRNQVRKAERAGLTVEFGGAEKLDEFYKIFAVNMRDLGSPVHDRTFFNEIFNAFGEQARVGLVRKDTLPIGGLIALAFENTLSVPWASSLREFFSLCPNMLLYWEILRIACMQGFHRFDFGRSSRNSGTYRFKRQWGALEEPLFWYTIPIGHRHVRQLSHADKHGAFLVQVWQRLPISVTRWLGPHVRKYLTQ